MESSDDGSKLSPERANTLITIERTGAGFSMVAIALTTVSYLAFKKLRTTPNMFLVFASLANAGASIASMMGYDGLRMGVDSALCQVQGFLFEWFMQSDPWWSCAMAVNVFLVFFNNADPRQFRKYTWVYCVICFGGPMLPAVVLISLRRDAKGPVIGDAALWCWISPNWSIVRLYAYYIPIWICILLSIFIYIAVGCHVFRTRNQLRNLAIPQFVKSEGNASSSASENRSSGEERCAKRNDCYGLAVTEVHVTSGVREYSSTEAITAPQAVHATSSRVGPGGRSWAAPPRDCEDQFPAIRTQQFETVCTSSGQHVSRSTLAGKFDVLARTASMKLRRLDPVKRAYLRTSFIFGLSVLITWIPSSVNRLYSLANQGQVSYPLSVASGCVLPLQGVWNAIIFFTTSSNAVRAEAKALKARLGLKRRDDAHGNTRLDLDASSAEFCDHNFGDGACRGTKWRDCGNYCGQEIPMVEFEDPGCKLAVPRTH